MNDFATRFGGIARLYSVEGLERLRRASVCIIGVGGVGSWVVEALARSGIGGLTLVDLDEVCVSNVNRQLPALDGTIGKPKVEVLAERARNINPALKVNPMMAFFTASSAQDILGMPHDYVVDAIDDVANKTLLVALCRTKGIPIITCGGAGGRRDATAVRIADFAEVTHDRLLSEVRKRLRKNHDFPPSGKKIGIDAVYSPEPPVFPQTDGTVGAARCEGKPGEDLKLNCDTGFGSATFVTGAFGFAAAGYVVAKIARDE